MKEPGGRPTRPTVGSGDRHDRVLASVVAIAYDLATVDSEQIEARIEEALATVGDFLGLVALGECTSDPGRDRVWFDEAALDSEELSECAALIDGLGPIDGPTGFTTATGRRGFVAPDPSGAPAGSFFALGMNEAEISLPACHAVQLVGTVISSGRRRLAAAVGDEWFRAAFSAAPIGISMLDTDMRLVECNEAYADLVGRPRSELIGMALPEVMSADAADEQDAIFVAAYDEPVEAEVKYRRPDGSLVWGSVRLTAMTVPGRPDPLIIAYVQDISAERRTSKMLEYQASHDELTSMPNRRALLSDIAAALKLDRRSAVVVVKLDHLKVVNDSLGHRIGDQLLIVCADRIRLSLRPGESVCRLSGDEFAILLPALASTCRPANSVVRWSPRSSTRWRRPVSMRPAVSRGHRNRDHGRRRRVGADPGPVP